MAGLVPAIHVSPQLPKAWMPGSSPGMTEEGGARGNYGLGSGVCHDDGVTTADYIPSADSVSEISAGDFTSTA